MSSSRRRGFLSTIIGLVAVLALVLGVGGYALWRDGILWSSTSVAAAPRAIAPTPWLHTPDSTALQSAPVAAALEQPAASPALGQFAGEVRNPATGEVLWSLRGTEALTPASSTKLLTVAAALLELGPDHRVDTVAYASPTPGEVIVVGGGDVTLTVAATPEEAAYPGGPTLAALAAQITAAHPEPIDRLVIDLSAFSGPTTAVGWDDTLIADGYVAQLQSFLTDGGKLDRQLNYSPRATNPAEHAAAQLAALLGNPAVELTETATNRGSELARVQSAPLTQRLRYALEDSDNIVAESLGFELAAARGETASFTTATTSTLDVLEAHGVLTPAERATVILHDNSGLSVDNRISPAVLTAVLVAATGTGDAAPLLQDFLGELPIAGATGTLADRYLSGDAAPAAGWVRAKTGTLTGVSALAGYTVTQDGVPVSFAFLSAETDPAQARPALDAVAAALHGCACG